MSIAELFQSYAEDFELTFVDDDWSRLEKYFTENAIYETGGAFASKHVGRERALRALKENISGFDRRCDSRTLETIEGPQIDGDTLSRRWRCTFTIHGAPDLIIIGDERAHFEGSQICHLEEVLSEDSQVALGKWIEAHRSKLLSNEPTTNG